MVFLTIRKIDNSLGVILPKDVLAALKAGEGDILLLTETPDGYLIHSRSSDLR